MANRPIGTITFLFSDIEGISRLWEPYPHAMQSALVRHDTILRAAMVDHNGVVFKTVGDGYHAVFQQAVDAVSAAFGAQRALAAEAWNAFGFPTCEPLRVDMAIHTGVANLRDSDYFGPTLEQTRRAQSRRDPRAAPAALDWNVATTLSRASQCDKNARLQHQSNSSA